MSRPQLGEARRRWNQENLIGQLKGGVRSLHAHTHEDLAGAPSTSDRPHSVSLSPDGLVLDVDESWRTRLLVPLRGIAAGTGPWNSGEPSAGAQELVRRYRTETERFVPLLMTVRSLFDYEDDE